MKVQPLTILYQDEQIVAIDKPAGLLVHRSRIDVSAKRFALQMLRDQIGQPVFPAHRIDRPTSGVLLFALDKETARLLAQQFEARTITKHYLAIVRGTPAPEGTWDEPLLEKPDRIVDNLADKNKPPQSAVTKFGTINSWEVPFATGPTAKYSNSRYSLVRIQPLTGRRHQIRRHFNHMGNPIVGDTTHGDRRHNRLFKRCFDVHRLLLVAETLEISHPVSKDKLNIKADPGVEFELAIQRLKESCIKSKIDTEPRLL